MTDGLFDILASDRRFYESASPAEGDPRCLCSRCGDPIVEGQLAVRCWPPDLSYELRYHPACVDLDEV